jgi:ribonucleoside-triphosphate reductase
VALLQKDKITLDPDLPYQLYSNQYIPLTAKAGVIARLDLSGRFMKMVHGGGIVHLNVEHQLDHPGKVYELMHFAMRSGVSHMAICHRFGMCVNGHTNIVGQSDTCPVCGGRIVRARNRVIGYYSDESNWHPVRQEHDARLRYFSDPDNLI